MCKFYAGIFLSLFLFASAPARANPGVIAFGIFEAGCLGGIIYSIVVSFSTKECQKYFCQDTTSRLLCCTESAVSRTQTCSPRDYSGSCSKIPTCSGKSDKLRCQQAVAASYPTTDRNVGTYDYPSSNIAKEGDADPEQKHTAMIVGITCGAVGVIVPVLACLLSNFNGRGGGNGPDFVGPPQAGE